MWCNKGTPKLCLERLVHPTHKSGNDLHGGRKTENSEMGRSGQPRVRMEDFTLGDWGSGSGMRRVPRGSRGPQEGQRWCCWPSPHTEHKQSSHRRAPRLLSLRRSPLCPPPVLLPAPGVSVSPPGAPCHWPPTAVQTRGS